MARQPLSPRLTRIGNITAIAVIYGSGKPRPAKPCRLPDPDIPALRNGLQMAGTSPSSPIRLCLEDKESDDVPERLWLIAADSGESFPLYREKLEAHAFAWSANGSQIFFSCASPLSKSAEEARKAQWKDVIRWREQERGDLLLAMPTAAAAQQKNPLPHPTPDPDSASPFPPLSSTIVTSEDEIKEIVPDPKGEQIAWVTDSVSHRFEDPKHNEIYLVSSAGGPARRLTNNLATENGVHWSPDGSKIFFHVGAASVRSTDRTATCRDGSTVSIPPTGRRNGWVLVLQDHSKTST